MVAPHPHPLLSKRAGGWRRDRLMGVDGLANLFQPSTPSWNAERNGSKSMRRKIGTVRADIIPFKTIIIGEKSFIKGVISEDL